MSPSSQSFQYELSLPESKYTQVLSTNPSSANTVNIAVKLRNYFDSIYKDPRAPDIRRFTWDPWYIRCSDGKMGDVAPLPGDTDLYYGEEDDHSILDGEREAVGEQIQYSLKRVQASTFFEDDSLYDEFIDEIIQIGKSIGLVSTTPPWLSLYTHNDLQNLHTDASHGPMAWVYALPPSENTYDGGDTMLMHPTILNFWHSYSFENFKSKEDDNGSGKELPSIIRFIPSKTLGKCIAFDPRVPHGVSQVKMKHPNDIREGRLVLHGWFAEPQIVWNGFEREELDLLQMMEEDENKRDENMELLQNTLDPLIQTLGEGDIGRVMGYLAVKIEVLRDGSIGSINAVCDTLVADPNDFRGIIGYDEEDRPVMEDAVSDVKLTIYESLKNIYFTEIEHDTKRNVIVPFSFE